MSGGFHPPAKPSWVRRTAAGSPSGRSPAASHFMCSLNQTRHANARRLNASHHPTPALYYTTRDSLAYRTRRSAPAYFRQHSTSEVIYSPQKNTAQRIRPPSRATAPAACAATRWPQARPHSPGKVGARRARRRAEARTALGEGPPPCTTAHAGRSSRALKRFEPPGGD